MKEPPYSIRLLLLYKFQIGSIVSTSSKIEGNPENHAPVCLQAWKAEFKSISTPCDQMEAKGKSQAGWDWSCKSPGNAMTGSINNHERLQCAPH